MISKNPLHEDQRMVDAVAAAQDMANRMLLRESRGPGDMDNAMRRLEAKYGIPYSFLWSLRYRPPRDILLGAWTRLVCAYQAECERQQRLLDAELATAKAYENAVAKNFARAAARLGGAKDREA